MSTFDVQVRRVTVEAHPDPEVQRLALGKVDGYISVIGKDGLKTGDLAVYIPEQAIVPETILAEMDLVGALDGKAHNRVKAKRLRGVMSQGLLYRPATWPEEWTEGTEVAGTLGITKWEPPIPLHMAGTHAHGPGGIFQSYTNIDSLQKHPELFAEGEQVRFTEKLHGSCCIVGIIDGQRVVSSKGLAGRHVVLAESDENVYWRAARQYGLHEKLEAVIEDLTGAITSILLFGEVLGVQDLKYGLANGQISYRAFDALADGFYTKDYFAASAFDALCEERAIPPVPVLYEGPFSWEVAKQHATGRSTLADHLREGIVIRPLPVEQRTDKGERKIAKLVSPDYLVRKGDVTEYE